jgi:hypothetical protein
MICVRDYVCRQSSLVQPTQQREDASFCSAELFDLGYDDRT